MRIDQKTVLPVTQQSQADLNPIQTTNVSQTHVPKDIFETTSNSALGELTKRSEELKETRDELKSQFQEVDEKSNEAMNKLTDIVKTLAAIRASNIRV